MNVLTQADKMLLAMICDAYSDYLSNIEGQIQNRISHFMIEKSNYDSADLAYDKISSIYESIQSKEILFEDADHLHLHRHSRSIQRGLFPTAHDRKGSW